jgi:hypothetical protein
MSDEIAEIERKILFVRSMIKEKINYIGQVAVVLAALTVDEDILQKQFNELRNVP